MKKYFKIATYILGGVVVLVIAFLIYFNSAFPKADPPSNEKVEITPARLERGKYLAHHVTVCMDCHSTRDWSKYSGPIAPGTLGKGGDKFDEATDGVPGVLYAKNITPSGISRYTDGELMRTITNGVTKEGKALFPLMPYIGYNNLTKEDLYSIVAYIRSLEPVKNDVPEGSLNFPLNLIVKTIPPKSYKPLPEPNRLQQLPLQNWNTTRPYSGKNMAAWLWALPFLMPSIPSISWRNRQKSTCFPNQPE